MQISYGAPVLLDPELSITISTAREVSLTPSVSPIFDTRILTVDLIKILWYSKETSSKVVGCLDHPILRLRPKHRQSSLLGKVVEQVSVLLSCCDPKLKVLRSTERSQELSTELVGPFIKEFELSP